MFSVLDEACLRNKAKKGWEKVEVALIWLL